MPCCLENPIHSDHIDCKEPTEEKSKNRLSRIPTQPLYPYTHPYIKHTTGPFYQYPLGRLSPYGAELLPLLRHLATQGKRGFDAPGFAKESAAFFKAYDGRLSHVPKARIHRDWGVCCWWSGVFFWVCGWGVDVYNTRCTHNNNNNNQ